MWRHSVERTVRVRFGGDWTERQNLASLEAASTRGTHHACRVRSPRLRRVVKQKVEGRCLAWGYVLAQDCAGLGFQAH
jgi:hypothetical protein